MRILATITVAMAFAVAPALAFSPEITDSAGRRVSISGPVVRIAPAGPPADVLLYALAPDELAGLVEPFAGANAALVPDAARALKKIPRITGNPDDAAIDALAALGADLFVDYGDVNPGFSSLADRMQARLGKPYALLDGRLTMAPSVLRTLGGALDRDARANELSEAISRALGRLKALSDLPDNERIAVYYARGADGLTAIRAGSSLDEGLALAGARNVTPAGRGAMTKVAIADVVAAKPSVVILADEKAGAPDSALRLNLPATTRFITDRGGPFGWIENPPSLNRLFGALALAEMLYPERARGYGADARALAKLLFPGSASASGLQ